MLTEQDIAALRVAKVGEVVETSKGKMKAEQATGQYSCAGCCCRTRLPEPECEDYRIPCEPFLRKDGCNVIFEKVEE